ncbi:MAG: hypothetical protein Q4B18_02075 [Bacillota bacterium]|nr:hypothetical protein [Bacillota bacterium]
MKIVIKTENTNFSMPVPMNMAAFAIKKIPESTLERFREKLPKPYDKVICKENLIFVFEECRQELEAFRGLEIVKSEREDGTYVSVVI